MLSVGTHAIAQGTVFIVKLQGLVEPESADCSRGISGFTGVNQRPIRLCGNKQTMIIKVVMFLPSSRLFQKCAD